MSRQMKPKDCQRVLGGRGLKDFGHPAWHLVPPAIRDQGFDAYEILSSR
jgi:hypothetical protein